MKGISVFRVMLLASLCFISSCDNRGDSEQPQTVATTQESRQVLLALYVARDKPIAYYVRESYRDTHIRTITFSPGTPEHEALLTILQSFPLQVIQPKNDDQYAGVRVLIHPGQEAFRGMPRLRQESSSLELVIWAPFGVVFVDGEEVAGGRLPQELLEFLDRASEADGAATTTATAPPTTRRGDAID